MERRDRLPKTKEKLLQTIGIKLSQGAGVPDLYVFPIDGKTIAKQLGVRRMIWHGQSFKAEGFQRALDKARVKDIAAYLGSNRILPNALVVAFERGALEFSPLPNQQPVLPQLGIVTIRGKLRSDDGAPVAENQRVGYVIDGQHRLKAIEESILPEGDFPIICSAFHGVPARFQLDQFYALNQTVQISPTHLALLRQELGLQLVGKDAVKKAISDVCAILMRLSDSPFQPEKHVKSAIYKGPLSINVVESMIERAIRGTTLRHLWKQDANQIPPGNLQKIAQSLYVYWKAVSEVFPTYWGKRPSEQRLFSALGIYTVTMFYNTVMENIDVDSANAVEQVKRRFDPIKDVPWDKMRQIPSTVKTYFRPENFFDAINDLWNQNGKRPYKFIIPNPAAPGGQPLVELELP